MNARHMIVVGVLMLSPIEAASQTQPDWSHAETLTIQFSNFQFTPSSVHLKQGQAYDLKFENVASGGHDLAAKEFFAAATIMDADRAKVSDGKVSLGGGQSIDVHLVAPAAGTYKAHCTHFMHSSFGMTGEIVVQ